MALAVVLILLVVGSVAFHFLSPWYFTPLASNWGLIDFTVNITFVVTGIVFVAANLFMATIIGATAMIGGGEEIVVTVDISGLEPGGDYTYFCSFPGHYVLMNGKFIIE